MKKPAFYLLFTAFLFLTLFIFSTEAMGQPEYQQFHKRSQQLQRSGMIVLGSWALANMATGAVGWSQLDGRKKYFHQMNFFWNTVNAGIAGYAIYQGHQMAADMLDADGVMSKHLKTETVLLVNSALDLGYIGTGFLLQHLGKKEGKNHAMLQGYGDSLLLQGGFLLVFDLALYAVLRSHRLEFLDNMHLSLSKDVIGFNLILTL